MSVESHEVLIRVRKLLALATSPNVHEAAAAAAAAQTLVERHRLHAALAAAEAAVSDSVANPITDGREAPLEGGKRLRRWKVALAAGLARANGCVAYTAAGPVGRDTLLLIAGRAEDRAAIAAIWAWLVRTLEWLSASEGVGKSRDWHEAFRIGAAEVVVARLAGVGAEVRQEEEGRLPGAELERFDAVAAARAEAVAAFVEGKLRLGRGRSMRVDRGGLEAGRRAGAGVTLGGRPDPAAR